MRRGGERGGGEGKSFRLCSNCQYHICLIALTPSDHTTEKQIDSYYAAIHYVYARNPTSQAGLSRTQLSPYCRSNREKEGEVKGLGAL